MNIIDKILQVATSKLQVMLVLALLGFFVPMGCTPILLIMFDVYKVLLIVLYVKIYIIIFGKNNDKFTKTQNLGVA